jgi:cell division protein FtsI (penicillin-binding protein 3)
LLVFLAVLLAVVGGRLAWIQVVQAAELRTAAEQQRTRDVVLPARRGSIFDREGQPLAVTSDAKSVYAVPTQVKDATATASAVARTLGGDAKDYLARLHRGGSFVYLARKVDLTRAAALQKLKIDGIGMIDDALRSYPGGQLACQILGFVGIDDVGLAGIEKQYDSTLAGTPGRIVAERDTQGRIIPGGIVTAQDPVDGQDVYLTIDKDIQFKAQVELAAAVKKFKAKGGSVVIMDPRDGEILAMTSTPFFDPNEYSTAKLDAMRNKAITDAYEPGSTIKSVTAASAIDAGLFTPASMFRLPPTLRVGDRTIHEAHVRGTVNYSLTDIVTQSSNIGAVKIGQALGKTRLANYFSRFGLSRKTGVDFPGEASGWMPPPSTWSASTMGNLPFGQGLSVTPLQLARALAAIANGGTLVTPHFLYRQASMEATFPPYPEKVISSRAATQATMMLTNVVRDGTGTEAAVSGYEVAGKTGTAQKPRVGGIGYMKGVYVSSFAGYLPAGDPRILIIVTIDSPRSGIYGGTVAAPAFSRLANFCVDHLRIAPAATVGLPPKTQKAAKKTGNKKVSSGGTGNDDAVESTSAAQ